MYLYHDAIVRIYLKIMRDLRRYQDKIARLTADPLLADDDITASGVKIIELKEIVRMLYMRIISEMPHHTDIGIHELIPESALLRIPLIEIPERVPDIPVHLIQFFQKDLDRKHLRKKIPHGRNIVIIDRILDLPVSFDKPVEFFSDIHSITQGNYITIKPPCQALCKNMSIKCKNKSLIPSSSCVRINIRQKTVY